MSTLAHTTYGTSLIVSVEQIVEGEAKCHCGADARLVVTTEPDEEPGPTCYEHAFEWIDLTVEHARSLFGPRK